jgi:Domain of unknown function (DUF4062)
MTSIITVFVCGTYSDLGAERGAVLDAIQRLQLRHDSMEFFGARPERPIETCLSEVRQSNAIVVIVGHRYGTLVPGREISYSEAEYDEAYRLGIPCLVYMLDDSERAVKDSIGQTQRQLESLAKWKSTLRERHTVWLFRESTGLALQVAVDLSRVLAKLESAPLTPHVSRTVSVSARPSVRINKRFGDNQRQLLNGLAVDNLGNIAVIGDFWGRINFGDSELVSAGDRDIFLAKFDKNGQHLWSARYGDELEQVGVGVSVDPEGSVLVASAFLGTLNFGGETLVSKGRYNIAIAKFDSSGQHVWSRSFGDGNYHVPECIAVAPSGRVTVAGRFKGVVDFGHGKIESKSNQTDIFVATFSGNGECLWAKQFGGPYEQQTRSISVDANGAIAITGVFKGAVHFDGHTLTEQQPTEYCGFLTKLDQDGNAVWCKRFGEPYVEQGSVVTFDSASGDLLAAGFIRNKLPAQQSLDSGSVCLFARYDKSGVLRWSKTFGGVYPDSLDFASDGRILFTGHFQNVVDFGLGPLKSAGGYDIAVAMFTPDGTPRWSKQFGDPRHQFIVRGAHVPGKSFVLAGSFHGTINFGTGPLVATGYDGINEGAEDVFLAIFEEVS